MLSPACLRHVQSRDELEQIDPTMYALSHDPVSATLCGMLESPKLSDLWKRYHLSDKDKNPAHDAARELYKSAGHFSENQGLLVFLKEFLNIQHATLPVKRKNDTLEDSHDRKILDTLSCHIESLIEDKQTPVPEEYQPVLDMLEHATGQTPVRPVRSFWNFLKTQGKHIAEETKEHPAAAASMLALSLGTLRFMNNGASTYIDPTVMQASNMDMDTLLSLDSLDSTITFNAQQTPIDLPCHDHIVYFLDPIVGSEYAVTGADFIKNTLGAAGLFPQHCAKLKTLAPDAQNWLLGGYDVINSRIAFMASDPAADLGKTVIPPSRFLDAYNTAVTHTSEFWYAFNAIENAVLHTVIFGSSMMLSRKLGKLSSEELTETLRSSKDFIYRTIPSKRSFEELTETTPLNYVLAVSGSAYAYVSNNGFNPEMVWMGLGGLVAGQVIHKGIRSLKSRSCSEEIMANASTDGIESLYVLSDVRAGEASTKDKALNGWQTLALKATIGAGIGTAAVTIDTALTGGQITASVLGGGSVTVLFLGYNVVEDAALHVIFGAAGGATGLGIALTERSIDYAKSQIGMAVRAGDTPKKEKTMWDKFTRDTIIGAGIASSAASLDAMVTGGQGMAFLQSIISQPIDSTLLQHMLFCLTAGATGSTLLNAPRTATLSANSNDRDLG